MRNSSLTPQAPDQSPNRRWIVVGNGPSVLSQQLGSLIDTYNEVVRFNKYAVHGFESHTGTKTTLWVFCGRGLTPADASQRPAKALSVHGEPGYQPQQVTHIPRCYYEAKRGEIQRLSRRIESARLAPSSGLLAILWLLETETAASVDLIGFDHFSKISSKQHHYWQMEAFSEPVEHDGEAETRLLEPLRRAGRIRYLTGGRSAPCQSCAPKLPPRARIDTSRQAIYRHATANVGDRASSPLHYFTDIPAHVTVIGGGIFSLDFIPMQPRGPVVAWGVGLTGSRLNPPRYLEQTFGKLDLVGIRDRRPGWHWAPCASCMSPLFDRPPEPVHELVLYDHAHHPLPLKDYPRRTNHEGEMDDTITHLASGATVVTSSYHGAYWAALLGRKVVMVPFNGKALGLPVEFCHATDRLPEHIAQARPAPHGYLEECRAATLAFKAKALELLT